MVTGAASAIGSGGPRVPGYGRTPLVDSQIPERPKELGISEEDGISMVMPKDTVGGECTAGEDVSDSVLHFAGFPTNALAGQALIVSRGGFME